MAETENSAKKNNRRILVIVVVAILLIVNGIQFYISRQNEQKSRELLQNQEQELDNTYSKLDSISGQLAIKIAEIEKLGGDIDSLLVIKEQLEQEKKQLIVSKNITQERYNQIKGKIEGYEFLLKKKDEEISKLKEVNEALLSENQNLKENRNELNKEIQNLQQQQEEINEKISEAAVLKAQDISFFAISKRGKERDGNEFRVRQLDRLKVNFSLAKNPLSELGSKSIYMRIIDPEGGSLYNAAAGSGTFDHNGEQLFFTALKEILYDNSGQDVQFVYDKGSEFKKGQYQVELYAEGALIGKKPFIVK